MVSVGLVLKKVCERSFGPALDASLYNIIILDFYINVISLVNKTLHFLLLLLIKHCIKLQKLETCILLL